MKMNENDIDYNLFAIAMYEARMFQECVKEKHSLPKLLDWIFDSKDTITRGHDLVDKIEIQNFLMEYKTEEEQFEQLKIIITECIDKEKIISGDDWNHDDVEQMRLQKLELANRITSFAVLIAICMNFKSYDEYLATYLADELTEPEDIWVDLKPLNW